MPKILSLTDDAGGTEINSYALDSNGGSGTVFSEVTGTTTEQLIRTITIPTIPGTTHMFRYRVKNIFGFSAGYSPVATVKSAKAPEMPATIATSISGQNVKISWASPFDNYDSITRYEVDV